MGAYDGAKQAGMLIRQHAEQLAGEDGAFPEQSLLERLGLRSTDDRHRLTEVLPDLLEVLLKPLPGGNRILNEEVVQNWGKPADVCVRFIYILSWLGNTRTISEEALKEVYAGAFNHIPSDTEWERALHKLRESDGIEHTKHGSGCGNRERFSISFFRSLK